MDLATFALIPGAGRSQRMGRDKLLLAVDGQPAVVRLLETALSVCEGAVLVLGANRDAVAEAIAGQPWRERVRIAVNLRPERGMFSSVLAGLAHVPSLVPLYVQPADAPMVSAATYRALLPALGGHDAVIPIYEGAGGHPVLLSPSTVAHLLRQPAESSLRDELHRLDVLRLAVPDPAILHNWNTPADITHI